MKPATEILLSAAFVLTPEENWTQGAAARTSRGWIVHTTHPDASCFCMVGAVRESAVALGYNLSGCSDAMAAVQRVIKSGAWGDWNDRNTHRGVLRVIYKAAKLSEES